TRWKARTSMSRTRGRRTRLTVVGVTAVALVGALAIVPGGGAAAGRPGPDDPWAQAGVGPRARAQIEAIMAEKASRTAIERKIATRVLYAAKAARGERVPGVARMSQALPNTTAEGS